MAGLSKSRIMSSLQCLKRVHLEIHRKDLLEYSKATEASFAIGHEVGDMARTARSRHGFIRGLDMHWTAYRSHISTTSSVTAVTVTMTVC